ncbi:hypothetical protein EDB85DRAFT_1901468 [Lactarius pseudohatsudake]|nr:hypothetical protein EDB85DRAFT_1901468 [Lactarius pseudohatsudake]
MTHPSGKPCENTQCRLTINPGEWDYDHWGHPGEPGVGSGAELWAWMGHGAAVQTRYRLPHSPFMDVLHTTSPAHAILPTADLPLPGPHAMRTPYTLCHTTLPTECLSHAGAAALLKPNRIFDVESPTGMV